MNVSPTFQTAPGSICILRLSAIGDVTHVLPLVHTIRHAWPQTRITWVIGRVELGLVAGFPDVEFVVFDKKKGWRAFLDLKKALAKRRFDVLLNLQVAFRASLASTLIRAPLKIGFDKQRARDYQWLFTNARIPAKTRQHVLDGFLEFAAVLGIREKILKWEIELPEAVHAFVAEHLPGDGAVLVLNPCSSQRFRNWRNWRAEYYAEVARHAADQHGMTVVLTGGPNEAERAYGREISQRCETAPVDLIGKTSLKQMAGVLKRATVVISPDTGPAHMANAVGTPVIGLYAASNPQRTGPYANLARVIDKYPEALMRECGLSVGQAPWGKRVRDPSVMDLIQPGEVTDMLDQILASP